MLKLYDLGLEKRTAVRSVLSAEGVVTGVNPVFTPALNTVKEDEIVDIIGYSGDEPEGVKVFGQIPGGEGNNFKKAQQEPAPAPGNGHARFSEEELEEVDEATKRLPEEFSFFGDIKNVSKMTPSHVCRKGWL